MNFQDELAKRTEETEKVIRSFLPAEAGFAGTMAQAMNYSMLAGGKRLRPMLIRETYCLFDGKEEVVKPFMAGMEMIHTHSLIHDDLPALDDDDYRRGRLTTHKVSCHCNQNCQRCNNDLIFSDDFFHIYLLISFSLF